MWRIGLVLCLLVIPGALLPACGGGGGGGGDADTREYIGTQSPGDLWSWEILSDLTWTASNNTLGYTYSGTWTTLPSGFLKLTILVTDEPGAMAGDVAYALEVPDTVLVVKPAGVTSNLIIAARIGTCPGTGTLDLNWVELTSSGFNELTDTAYGTSEATISGPSWSVSNAEYLLDGSPNGVDLITTLSCSGGLITDSGAPSEVIAIAPTGVFISDSGPGAGGVIGMSEPAAPIVLSDLVAAGREYRSFQYKDASIGIADSRANWARPNGTGGLTGGDYVDIETNAEDASSTATILFTSQPSPGVVRGTLTDGAGTSDIVFMVNRIDGRYFLFGVAVDTNDGLAYNFVAIEQ